ncbi:MAG: phosphatase PAP2 family protein [Bacteroidia bacterium]
MRTALILLLYLTFSGNYIFCQVTDSVSKVQNQPKSAKIIKAITVPAICIGYGISATGNNGLYSSKQAQQNIQVNFKGFHTKADDYMVLAPAAGVYALHFAGIKGKNTLADKTILLAASGALTGITVLSLKEATHFQRPDNTTFNSLPSGHTAYAFTAAEFMHQEYKEASIWYSVAGYSVATATGTLRMLNNRHWLSDVLIGAGIGMLSVKAVYAVYPLVKKKVFTGRSAMFMPGYANGKVQLAFVYRF